LELGRTPIMTVGGSTVSLSTTHYLSGYVHI
jgi:hypothetical protein